MSVRVKYGEVKEEVKIQVYAILASGYYEDYSARPTTPAIVASWEANFFALRILLYVVMIEEGKRKIAKKRLTMDKAFNYAMCLTTHTDGPPKTNFHFKKSRWVKTRDILLSEIIYVVATTNNVSAPSYKDYNYDECDIHVVANTIISMASAHYLELNNQSFSYLINKSMTIIIKHSEAIISFTETDKKHLNGPGTI